MSVLAACASTQSNTDGAGTKAGTLADGTPLEGPFAAEDTLYATESAWSEDVEQTFQGDIPPATAGSGFVVIKMYGFLPKRAEGDDGPIPESKHFLVVKTQAGWFGEAIGETGGALCKDTSSIDAEHKDGKAHIAISLSCEEREAVTVDKILRYTCVVGADGEPLCVSKELPVPEPEEPEPQTP